MVSASTNRSLLTNSSWYVFKSNSAFLFLQLIHTEHVKPICMMSSELLKKDFIGETAEVAGWGIYDISKTFKLI